jgi:hypothetical protein
MIDREFVGWTLGAISGLFLGALLASTGPDQTLPACQSEDSTNCVWDAHTQGNGKGTSFVNLDGTAYREVSR